MSLKQEIKIMNCGLKENDNLNKPGKKPQSNQTKF